MENENTCARCGKPCPEGEFMCAECNTLLDEKDGQEKAPGFDLEEILRSKEKPEDAPDEIPATVPVMMSAKEAAGTGSSRRRTGSRSGGKEALHVL